MTNAMSNRLRSLERAGVNIIDPRQTYIDDDVQIDRICAGAILHPGTRLIGRRTFIGPGAVIGREGPAVLQNSVIGATAEVGSGFLNEAVLLSEARVGSCAHVRAGTLLEEAASTAHAVGLKHTILLCFATLGSVINCCDALVYGGKSRREHSEIGSGFIHFNFTPWGQQGDKATPSLIGDVASGVFLREPRIFIGGASGLVGPQRIGFGSMTAAGQVIREEVPRGRLVRQKGPEIDRELPVGSVDSPQKRLKVNLEYIGQLVALKAWYQSVRLARIPASPELAHRRIVIDEAINTIQAGIDERLDRLNHFLSERDIEMPALDLTLSPCPTGLFDDCLYTGHRDWVYGLSDDQVELGKTWLREIAENVPLSYFRRVGSNP